MCRESYGFSHVTLSVWWPLQAKLCCCWGHGHIFVLWLDSQISAPSRKQPLNTGRGHPHCHPELFSLQGAQPPTLYIYIPSSCGFGSLSHLSVLLVLRPPEPMERRGPLCPALQNLMLHQTSKDCSDMLPGDPWWNETSPVRNC